MLMDAVFSCPLNGIMPSLELNTQENEIEPPIYEEYHLR